MVADTLIYHPTLSKLIKFWDSTPKREKTFRLLSYLSRFLGYYAYKKGYSKETIELWSNLKGHFTFIRKAMRFFKPINHLQLASKAYDNKLMDPILQFTTIIRNLGYAGYLTIDAIVFFKLLGIIDKKKYPNLGKYASRFWLIGLISGLINSLRIIYSLNSYENNIEKQGEEINEKEKQVDINAINQKLYQAKRKLIWDSLDTFIALNSLDILHFTEGDVGLAGVITSLLGLQDLWKAT
ncbi:peroxisomal membrane protein, putative [Candida dubliniensis CD36]|uniref:Peroxisomal membrane protein, putative n=1 Tax=Candida dubliniensis (strain CD36 / ATCC MYA-646 / CBS 7987 / NCPF 3949 / NRRL Y-17841) TaxID=573826 RepID=B9WJA8_CANDC|nr:peroxisomal membrane protein, putative [Candida dubliniensis CD36]CAX41330.1 peroxisomal membrane protein, putative [Candida dubliniensis CD36]